MLRNRSRTVRSKQAIMSDHSSLPSPIQNQTTPVSSFFGSPKFFNGFLTKGLSDADTIMSPTSILNFGNSFGYDQNQSKPPNISSGNKHLHEKLDSKGIGLALIDSLNDDNFSKSNSRMVLFGSNLKIHIPAIPSYVISPANSPKSPADFGIKTRNSQFLGTSSGVGSMNSGIQTEDSPLSLSEMELSEDYTCVISRGPSPRTTHIYDNCIVESSCGGVGLPELKKEYNLKSPSQNFLSFCYTCKKNLGEARNIFMYSGEKAFCSHECRYQKMLFDGVKNLEVDDASSTCS